jgi:nitrous oxide reductase
MSEQLDPFGEFVENYLNQKMDDQGKLIEMMAGDIVPIEQLRKIIKDTNQYINLYCAGDRETFEEVKYNLLVSGTNYSITRGKPWDVEP